MIAKLLPALFLGFQPAPGTTQPVKPPPGTSAPVADTPALAPAQLTAIRCSAAFALVATRQSRGDEAAREYPTLTMRGREFFVQSGARLMEETGLTRPQMEALMRREAQAIVAGGNLDAIMPPCLLLLDASGI